MHAAREASELRVRLRANLIRGRLYGAIASPPGLGFADVWKIVFSSSATVYGNAKEMPVTECAAACGTVCSAAVGSTRLPSANVTGAMTGPCIMFTV